MDSFVTDLPGEFKVIIYLIAGLLIGLPVLGIPKKVLAKIGKLPGLSPNWVSFWRLPMTWIGFLIYSTVSVYVGFCIVVFAFVLDRLDGKMATALAELNDPLHPGKTKTGEWFDPLIDKLTFAPLLVVFWWKGILWLPFIAVTVAAEIMGTLIRHPFNLFQNRIRTNSASIFSKLKAAVQHACLLTCLPLDQGWMDYSLSVPNIVLGIATLLAVLSVIARFKLGKEMEKNIDGMTAHFHHNE